MALASASVKGMKMITLPFALCDEPEALIEEEEEEVVVVVVELLLLLPLKLLLLLLLLLAIELPLLPLSN